MRGFRVDSALWNVGPPPTSCTNYHFFTNEKLENNILIEQFESEATHRHKQDIGKGHLARPGWSDGASIRYQVLPCCTETKT